ncbi:hypothetical protein D3C77_134040 [compost metagenome]
MLTITIILAIVACIGIGYWQNINIGLLAISAAYLIATSMMGISVKELVSYWPLNLFFIIFAVTFFFGFVIANGTMDKIARHVVYMARGMPSLIPFAMYGLVILVSAIGPGHYAVFVFLSPLVMSVASRTGMSRLLGAIIVVCGGMATTFTSISLGGRVTQGILENVGYSHAIAADYTHALLIDSFTFQTLAFLLGYVLLGGYRTQTLETERPEPFTAQQRRTLWLVLLIVGLIIVPSAIAAMLPAGSVFGRLATNIDPTFISIVGVVLALMLRVGDEKAALANVPWAIIILLCGMGMLINVAVKAGTIAALSQWLMLNVSTQTMPFATAVVASMMSFFSSTLGVVMPTLFPILPDITNGTGLSPTLMVSVIVLCASLTGLSPFSSGGALALAGVQEDSERAKLFYRLLWMPLCGVAGVVTFILLGLLG